MSTAPDAFLIVVDERPVPCRAGQSIGAALVAAGIVSWHTLRRSGARRGIFCGIGVCFDCLVTINGEGPLRACLVTARPGDRVSTVPASGS